MDPVNYTKIACACENTKNNKTKIKMKQEEEEDGGGPSLRHVSSSRLLAHVYTRHSKELWGKVNLFLSTLAMFAFARSLTRPRLFSAVLFGIAGSELSHIWLILQLLNLRSLYNRVPKIFLEGWFGKICILLNMGSGSVLMKNLWEGLNARDEFSKGLVQAGITPTLGGRFSSLLSLIPLFVISRRGKSLEFNRNIKYGDISKVDPRLLENWKRTPSNIRNVHMVLFRGRVSQWMSLDVIKLSNIPKEGGAPICLAIHGGGWCVGDKLVSCYALYNRLASRGIIVANANYRLCPECPWPAQIIDIKRALVFVKKNARAWGGDPNKIFVVGESAGGHLSALVGATPNYLPFQPPEDIEFDTSVAGVMPIYGVFDWSDSDGNLRKIRETLFGVPLGVRSLLSKAVVQTLYGKDTKSIFDEASPTYHVRRVLKGDSTITDPKLPPYFIPHGSLDALAAFHDSKQFFDELQKLRKKFPNSSFQDIFVEVSGGVHGFGYGPTTRSHAMGDAFADFVLYHSKRIDGNLSKL